MPAIYASPTVAVAAPAGGYARQFAYTITGNGSTTTFPVVHNIGSADVSITVFALSGAYDDIIVESDRADVNTVNIVFDQAPVIGDQYRVVIQYIQAAFQYAFTITGNGYTQDFVIAHSYNTRDVAVTVFHIGGVFSDITTTVQRVSTNQVTISFDSPPTVGDQYRVIILSA